MLYIYRIHNCSYPLHNTQLLSLVLQTHKMWYYMLE